MKKLAAAFTVLCVGFCCAQTPQTPQPKRLYIEERVKTASGSSTHCDTFGNCYSHQSTKTRNVSLEVTREVMKQCPGTLIVTDNRDEADFDLRISPGSSTLFKKNGDAGYVSPAKFRIANLAKDICAYADSQN